MAAAGTAPEPPLVLLRSRAPFPTTPDCRATEFKRPIKTQTVLPSAETASMLFWSLRAAGQITMRKVDGWQSLDEPPSSLL